MELWHNPRCSKSRQALQLLHERGLQPALRLYLEHPPTAAELQAVLRQLDITPRQLLRTGEPDYSALGLDDPGMTDAALIAAMAAHPRLIERPILIVGDHARIGRPPERIVELL